MRRFFLQNRIWTLSPPLQTFIFTSSLCVDMARIYLGFFLSFGMFLFTLCVSPERQQSQSGFRRLYVLQPGPGPGTAGANGGVRVSSISSLHGLSGQPHTYNVELTANFGGQVRSRRMGKQAASAPQQPAVRQEQSQKQLLKLSG